MKKFFYLVIAVAVVFFLVWLLNRPAVDRLPQDTATSIQSDVDSLDLGNLDKEFQGIDADLSQL